MFEDTKKCQKMPSEYICKECDFKCSKQSDYNRHLMTAKHQNRIFEDKKTPKNPKKPQKTPKNPKSLNSCGTKFPPPKKGHFTKYVRGTQILTFIFVKFSKSSRGFGI